MWKNVPETVQWIKKVRILWRNGLNFKLKHRNAQKSILSGRFGTLTGRSGDLMKNLEGMCYHVVHATWRLPGKPGELAGMRLGRGILLWSYLLHIHDVLIKSRAPVSRVRKFELSLSSCCHYLLNSKSNPERWELSFFTLITGWAFFDCSWGNEVAGNLYQ